MRRVMCLLVLVAAAGFGIDVGVDGQAHADEFEYMPPGELESGHTGYTDDSVYLPDMRFPMESAPAYPNSQLWNQGGVYGGGGSQCHSSNYSYPWYDNFCEPRQWTIPSCPGGTGHQGQDIRPASCVDSAHRVVASEAGQITSLGSYTVRLDNTSSGTRHRYMHMNMNLLYVEQGDWVEKGDPLGYVSNDFGGTPTTIHLHYDIYQGNQYVSPYMSLVESYKELPGVDGHVPEYGVDLEVRYLGLEDFYDDGSSRGLLDALEGDEFRAEILLTNESNERLESVEIGYLIQEPFLETLGYTIETDHPEYDRHSWTTNDADPQHNDGNPGSLDESGHLEMHGFAPGETKRVVVDLRANEYSIGRTDHVDVRAWLVDAYGEEGNDDVFAGHGGGWHDEASSSELGSRVIAWDEIDILSTDEWLFESMKDEGDLEGWQACYPGHHSELIHNTNFGALALEIAGDRACVGTPPWTSVDANTYDEMVVEMRSHNGAHTAALYWAGESDLPSFDVPCDEVDRVAGANRFESSVAVSEDAFEAGADEAVLVYGGEPNTDALVGATLAARVDGPLLLTQRGELPDSVRAELQRLNPDRVTVIGGTAVVSDDVVAELEQMGADVVRRYGQQRFQTAHAVAQVVGAPTNTAVVVSGADESLIDGVYGAALAAHLNAPVLLVGRDIIPTSTSEALNELNVQETIIIGGTGAVSESVEQALPSPLRLGGANRHETALKVAGFALETGLDADDVYIARDDNLIDSFSAGAVGDVLMVSPPDGLTTGVKTALTGYAESATLVGGEAALSEQVERDACEAFRNQHAFDTSRAVSFEAPGDGDFHHLVLPLGAEFAEWSGEINFLRMMPLYHRSPGADASPWHDIGEVFFQNSTTQETSSDVRDYVSGPYADIEELEDPADPDDGSDDGAGASPPAEGGTSDFVDDSGDIQTERDCSATGGSPAGIVFAALVLLGLLRVRK